MESGLIPAERPFIRTVPRRDWLKTDKTPKYNKHKPARIVVHHSAAPTAKQFHGDQTIQGIHRYHTVNNKWSDIGYHFLISPDGSTIFEGRPVDAVGAHCGGTPPKGVTRSFGNTGSIGICLVGDYDNEQPTDAALHTLAVLIVDLCEKWQIDSRQIYGHCEAWSRPPKSCPGKNLFVSLFGRNRWEALKI